MPLSRTEKEAADRTDGHGTSKRLAERGHERLSFAARVGLREIQAAAHTPTRQRTSQAPGACLELDERLLDERLDGATRFTSASAVRGAPLSAASAGAETSLLKRWRCARWSGIASGASSPVSRRWRAARA